MTQRSCFSIKMYGDPARCYCSKLRMLIIEASIAAQTAPTNLDDAKKYEERDKDFYSQIFKSDFNTVAVQEKKYELLRFWLLGNWIAKEKFRFLYYRFGFRREGAGY